MLIVTTIYLLSLITWIGSILFFSFIGAPSIFKSLPPEYAGKAVGVIFSKYYPLGYISGFIAFACLIFSAAKTGHWSPLKMILLILMLTMTIYTSLVIHPKARALKEEIQASQKASTEIIHLQTEFDHVHHLAVILNSIVLFLGIVLVITTAKNLIL